MFMEKMSGQVLCWGSLRSPPTYITHFGFGLSGLGFIRVHL
jgi:hypothetical protein